MRRALLLILSLTVITPCTLCAASFTPARIAPDWGLDALTRGVARQALDRDLFSDPHATVTLGNVDVYDVFPYVETRTFQVVSDPQWNRLVYGEMGRTLKAYDGQGQPLGALRNPRGMSVDERNRVYVADTGNDRVLVLQASTEYGEIALVPQFEIREMSQPFDVAYSDGGTPFASGDDWLYVADTGRNRVVAYALETAGARRVDAIGDLGAGVGRFAGPMAITVGRAQGANTADVYVADAHTQRLVHLRNDGQGLRWVADASDGAAIVTSLDTDQWGNLYAAAPNEGVVRKFDARLAPLAELRGGLERPRSFRVPFFTVHDHRTGVRTREGRPSAVSIEQWSDTRGVREWRLGVDVADLAVVEGRAAQFMLTDPARVTLELLDGATHRRLAHRDAGTMTAGHQTLAITDGELAATSGARDVLVRVTATSLYTNGGSAVATAGLGLVGDGAALGAQAMVLGASPNPVVSATRISFVLPEDPGARATLRLYDATGRLMRTFAQPFAAGRNEVVWDGSLEGGARVAPGVYFVRLRSRDRELTERLVLVR